MYDFIVIPLKALTVIVSLALPDETSITPVPFRIVALLLAFQILI
jgi:hypothetical protein